MIIFLYGPDNFSSRKKLNEIIERFKKRDKSGLDLAIFDSENLDFACFKNVLITPSFLNSKKLVIIKNLLIKGSLKLIEEVWQYGSQLNRENTIVVFWEENKPDKRSKLFKLLKNSGHSQEFKLFENYQINDWIKKELEEVFSKIPQFSPSKKYLISPNAQKKIAASVNSNLWQTKNEIDKLAFYKLDSIESDDIDLLIASSITSNVFNIIDALGDKNQKQALKFLHEQLKKGENEIYLFSMIVYQFRNLIKVKSYLSKSEYNSNYSKIAKAVGLHPYVVQKTIVQVKKFSLSELKEIYQKLLNLDLAIKTGRIEPSIALDLLVIETTNSKG